MTNPVDMTDRQAMASLFRKKAAVMDELGGGMEKKGKNEHFDYKFVTASDIKRTVSALFKTYGLSLQMSGVQTDNVVTMVEVKDYQTKGTRMKEVPILRIQFSICLCDIDTGAVEQSFWFGEAAATDDKAASKAATSALKYYLISNLMIADKDEDNHDTDNQKARKQRQNDAPPPPAANGNASAPQKPAQPPSNGGSVLSSTDRERWPIFLKWANDKFGYDEGKVKFVLRYEANGGVISGDRNQLAARVLAEYANYKPDLISTTAVDKKITEDIERIALGMKMEIPF